MVNATVGTIFEVINVGFRPYPLLPYSIVVLRGFADLLTDFVDKPPQFLATIIFNVSFFFFIAMIWSTGSMFLFRYLQTAQLHEHLRRASNMKLYLISFVIAEVIGFGLVVGPINLQMLSSDELKAQIQIVDPQAYEHMVGSLCIGFSVGF
jgi:hypothetical protein